MLCQDALVKKCLTARPDQSVESLLKEMRKDHAGFVPVVEDGLLVGLFSIGILLEDLLPVSLAMAGGEDGPTNVMIPAAPGMATRLRRNLGTNVGMLMQRPARFLYPDTPLEAAIHELRDAGGAAAVVERKTNAFLGIVTNESALAALEKKAA
jgi:CBS domain-containing protein